MDKKTLKLVGAALYACEGTKARRDYRTKNGFIRSIELTNSEATIITLFSRFLNEIINADWKRVRGQVFFYPDLEENKLINYWSDKSGIPTTQFQKSILLKEKKSKFKASPYGTFKIRYSCKADFIKLEEILKELWVEAEV